MQFHFSREDTQQRTRQVKDTLRCPHCDGKLDKWEVPDTPFIEWASEFQYICFNDDCPYFKGGWRVMASQRNACSYRFMYDPSSGGCHAIPVLTNEALRENIVHTA
jgi:hypothetical protein